jgi:hypothetical protein
LLKELLDGEAALRVAGAMDGSFSDKEAAAETTGAEVTAVEPGALCRCHCQKARANTQHSPTADAWRMRMVGFMVVFSWSMHGFWGNMHIG